MTQYPYRYGVADKILALCYKSTMLQILYNFINKIIKVDDNFFYYKWVQSKGKWFLNKIIIKNYYVI